MWVLAPLGAGTWSNDVYRILGSGIGVFMGKLGCRDQFIDSAKRIGKIQRSIGRFTPGHLMSTSPNILGAPNAGEVSIANDPQIQESIASLKSSRKLVWNGSADQAVAELNLVGKIDAFFTRKQKFWTRWLIAIGAAIVASIFVAVVAAGMEFGALGLVIVVPCVLAFVFAGIKCWQAGKLNFDDRRHKMPAQLVEYLKTDIPPDRPVELEVDFRHYRESSEFQTAKDGGVFSSITKTEYEVPWFNLKGQLYDGSKFRLKIVQGAKRKEKRKRKRTKVTETFCDKYNLIVAVKPARYPGLTKFQTLIASAKPIEDLRISMAKVEGNRITIQAISTREKYFSTTSSNKQPVGSNSADPALQLFLACYHCLGQCRTI
jgi:hypothetical protein